MTVIDNKNKLEHLLEFQEGYMYHLVVLCRKKDAESKKSSSLIRDYYITSKEYLDRKYPEILGLVEFFRARAYINLRRVDKSKLGLNIIKATTHKMESGDDTFTKVVSKAVGMSYDRSIKRKWIIDIDGEDSMEVSEKSCNQLSALNIDILSSYPTKNGHHLIVEGFDVRLWDYDLTKVDIKKEGCALIAYHD